MQALEERDYFTDHSILRDPYSFFEALRAKGPIYEHPESGIIYVTGYDETLEVLKNNEDFSSSIATGGPARPLPFKPEGSDITGQIEAHRAKGDFLGGDLVVAYDGRAHAMSRALLARLFTPSRLRANEQFISDYSDELVRNAAVNGGCELIKDIATPFVTMVIADLLGVPDDDRRVFMDAIEAGPPPGSLDAEHAATQNSPLVLMGTYFAKYVLDRRANPRDDILSELANAKFPDGGTPDAMEIVRLATFLFGAGQDTSAKLLGNTMRFIVEQPGLQDQLRADPSLVGPLLEEVLRLEGSTKMTARLARKDTQVAGRSFPAGTKFMLALAAANRDPRRWEDPKALVFNRPRIKEHLAFGRGAHVCAGAPLARVEVRVILEKFLEHTTSIALDEAVHGPAGASNLEYEASFIIRGLESMHLKMTPKPGVTAPIGSVLAARTIPAAAAAQAFSTKDSKIGDLLDAPAAKAVLDKHFPGVTDNPQISMAKGMTLRMIQAFAPDMFTTEALDAVDADLARLPVG